MARAMGIEQYKDETEIDLQTELAAWEAASDEDWLAFELLLQSLKEEIAQNETVQTTRKPFRVQTFDLGADITVDREEMYAERVS